MLMTPPHFGHLVCLPAPLSGALNWLLHDEHATWIDTRDSPENGLTLKSEREK
jgi:hypothetical protein